MDSSVSGRDVWTRWVYPILAGAGVGLATGLFGLFATTALYGTPAGGLVGAVGCGVTAASLSSEGLFGNVANAVVADVVSSVAFFLLVLVAYLAFVWLTEGLTVLSALWFSTLYLLIGGLGIAVPVGLVSLVITAVSGTITTLVKQRVAEPTATG